MVDLDPEFSADGKFLFYSSGEDGSLELHRRHLEAGTDETLTDLDQVVRNARRLPGGGSGCFAVSRAWQGVGSSVL